MQVDVIKTRIENKDKINGLIDPFVKKVFPEFKAILLPTWLVGGEQVWVYEKEGVLMLIRFWSPVTDSDSISLLFQFKAKWEQFIKTFERQNRVVLVLLAERFPDSFLRFNTRPDEMQLFEIVYLETAERLFVKELTSEDREEEVPRVEVPRKYHAFRSSKNELGTENSVSSSGLEGQAEAARKEIKSLESPLKQNATLASFFYKMGKLSEEELARFLDLETDPPSTTLSH